MRIALLDVARAQQARLSEKLAFAHEFVTPQEQRQTVDAVVALRFGRAEAASFSMRLLHLPGAGADAVETGVLDSGCVVCNVFEHEVPVSEFILAAVLEHTIGYSRLVRDFDSARWAAVYGARKPHGEVAGKTLGLMGYGHIGRAVARRAKAFGMQVHAISHSGKAPEADWAAPAARLDEMLPRVDFLVIACPLTPETRGVIDAAALARMKPTAVIINIGRAQVIEEEALYRALQAGRLGGATLDVWYEYPSAGSPDAKPSRWPFEQLPNVQCTAHSSAWTEELFARRYGVIADNLTRLRQSLPLRNIIFPAA